MPNYNSPRYYRLYSQIQTGGYAVMNNSTGTWTSTNAQLQRIDQGSFTARRNAPYSRFPVLTGTRSEVIGIRGRKNVNAWSIRGMPIIPSGAAGVVPNMDMLLGNIFGVATGTVVASTSVTYGPFVDSGNFPLALLWFNHAFTTMSQFYYWGAFVERWQINFNGPFLTIDLDGFAGWGVDSTGFGSEDTAGLAGLTAFPVEPVSPAVAGQPIAGFGAGYTLSLASQNIECKTRVLSIGGETGWVQVQDVYCSPYPIAAVGDSRRMYIQLSALDDDSTQLNAIKTACDVDNGSPSTAVVVAGAAAGSIMTTTLNSIQLNAFDLTEQGPIVLFDLPTSYGHASSVGNTNDLQIQFT
jgi:hypothetical protein